MSPALLPRKALPILAAGILLSAVFLGCGGEVASDKVPAAAAAPAEVRRQPGLDVLLITVDTLRADALGSYGRQGAGTPLMDRLAEEGVRFEQAYAHNALTLPSHANILSGLYPQEHGVRDNSGFRYPDDVPTLPEILRREGYRTAAFVSAFPLDSRFGLDRGFDLYEDSFVDAGSRPVFLEQERAGAETVALAAEWLASDDPRPSFAWVHIYEPHFPYAPPPALAERFAEDPYQGDVAAADAALAALLEPIFAAADGGDTLVVLTSDHGESLGEHGEATHGIFGYQSVLTVPLILHQPGLLPPRVVRQPVQHVDLAPTILDLLAVPAPDGLRGRSLLGLAAGPVGETAAAGDAEAVYFEVLSGQLNRGWAPLYGVVLDGWKYIDLPIAELYDLEADPGEIDNLADSRPEEAKRAREALTSLRELDSGSAPSPESAEVRRRLSALGYLGSEAPEQGRVYTAEDDPKNLIGLDEALRRVATLYEAGDLQAAVRLNRQVVERRPGMRMALLQLAQLERASGDLAGAVETLRTALALNPEDAATLALLATYLTQAGEAAEAVEVTEPHARGSGPDVEVLLTRALALTRMARPAEALSELERATALDPANARVAVYRGTVHLMQGQRDQARVAYESALALNPNVAAAHSSLAIMALEDGALDRSLEHWRSAVEGDPRELGKLFAIGTRLWSSGRTVQARPLLELFEEVAPERRYGGELRRARQLLAAAG